MGLLVNKTIKKYNSVEEYDEAIDDKQEQVRMLQKSRRKLIKEQWEVIEIQFHEKDHWEDQRLTVEYRNPNKKSDTTEILFEYPSVTQFRDLLQEYKNNNLYKERRNPSTLTTEFHLEDSINPIEQND